MLQQFPKAFAYLGLFLTLVFPLLIKVFTSELISDFNSKHILVVKFNVLSKIWNSNPLALTATSSAIAFTLLLIYVKRESISLPDILKRAAIYMNSGFNFGSAAGRSRFGSMRNSKEQKFAIKNGGEPGGISNDGNTCFMNSVLQSLASSRYLLKFIDSYLYSEITIDEQDGKPIKMRSNTPKPELVFTTSLKTLLDNINGSYGAKGKEFSTKPLLNRMPNGPKQNFFTGYNQEDAQEFYQVVMGLLESEFKKVNKTNESINKDEKSGEITKFVDSTDNLISGCEKIGRLGEVCVPASQVDPNLVDCDHKVLPLKLVTPVDGISAERIGCLSCGEVGGIRYSVNSGLSLNLPYRSSYYSSFNLEGLLDEWIAPEIIEDVNCNRCGLVQTKEFLTKQLESSTNVKISNQLEDRIKTIDHELEKPHITDEVFEKATIKQMIRKTKKSKQIYLSRPPPLLSIHINRSVFDPNTYRIAKNASNVTLPAVLDLSPYTVEPKDVNMDARLSFRKQDVRNIRASVNGKLSKSESAYSSSSSSSSDDENEEAQELNSNGNLTPSTKETDIDNISSTSANFSSPSLRYNLKAVISHYGTHNYGHYICYRKLRGTWWRISDESVYVVTEQEVSNGQGAFMVFYEFEDGYQEPVQQVTDTELSESESEGESKEFRSTGNRSVVSRCDGSSITQMLNSDKSDDIEKSSSEGEDRGPDGDNSAVKNNESMEIDGSSHLVGETNDFNLGDERAHL
ncbi:uncharacterized protein PRCAT00005217001 [Priceomyces carsonii]|uniref:uncharacterized protein n=1 Tax=Priceomyces carsonii TaxID=28549 RepID=UPI002ED7F1AA|nr:unnamed protein product [Priceomyces carsonii]